MKSVIVVFLLTIVCFSCSRKESYSSLSRPNFTLTYKKLLSAGFTPVVEDVPILMKHFGDTLIYYQFDDGGEVTDVTKPEIFMQEYFISRADSTNFMANIQSNYSIKCSNQTNIGVIILAQDRVNNLFYEYSVSVEDTSRLKIHTAFNYPNLN